MANPRTSLSAATLQAAAEALRDLQADAGGRNYRARLAALVGGAPTCEPSSKADLARTTTQQPDRDDDSIGLDEYLNHDVDQQQREESDQAGIQLLNHAGGSAGTRSALGRKAAGEGHHATDDGRATGSGELEEEAGPSVVSVLLSCQAMWS